MNKAVFRLLNSYYWKGFFGPFFALVFPVLLLFILGNAFYGGLTQKGEVKSVMQNLVAGIMITSILSIGFFNVPIMIIEFKKSTLIKRIGAAKITKRTFLTTILLYQGIWMFFSILWVMTWAGIFIGTKSGVGWGVAFPPTFWISLPYIIFAFILSLSIGILIVSSFNTVQGVMGISNVIYMPISFLSGSFFPKSQINDSVSLNIISYMLPTKYVVDPFYNAWNGGTSAIISAGWESYVFPIIAVCFILLFFSIAIKKFKWSN